MNLTPIECDKHAARRLWKEYRGCTGLTKADQDIARIYYAISRGKVVIDAHAAVLEAGLNADGLPKLALARADATVCRLEIEPSGDAEMKSTAWVRRNAARGTVHRFRQAWPRSGYTWSKALLPHIPPKYRPPASTLRHFDILWEAEWRPIPPVDPVLLRQIGDASAWVVVAAWDLTEVERAVMAAALRRR